MRTIHVQGILAPLLAIGALSVVCADARADYLAMSGAELYGRFCASCHGTSGQGDGPVAASLKVEVPDLTLIARRQGTFPKDKIERVVDGRHTILAHGTRAMPVWGQEFLHNELGNPDAERATRLMIDRLVEHVRALQRSAPAKKDSP